MESSRIRNAVELLEKSAHVLVALPASPSLDQYAAAEALLRTAAGRGKSAALAANTPPPSDAFRAIAGSAGPLREFVVSVDTSASPLSELHYERRDGAVDIVLVPKQGPLGSKNISFGEGKTLCDCLIQIGTDARTAQPDDQERAPTVVIDTRTLPQPERGVALADADASSAAEITAGLIAAWNPDALDAETATLLAAGILEETEGLRTARPEALECVSRLMRAGADRAAAERLAAATQPVALVQLFGRATVRSRLENDSSVLWSFLTREDFEKTGRSPDDAEAVLDFLDRSFPQHRVSALLMQPSGSPDAIRTVLSGERGALERIRERVPAAFRSPHLELLSPEASFRDAEEHLAVLLKAVL